MAGSLEVIKLRSKKLVITRKRKKYKFAHFNAWPNCFDFNHEQPAQIRLDLDRYFKEHKLEKARLVLELAAGNAQFSLELAKLQPSIKFIAIDIKSDRLYTSAKQAQVEGITNIAFVRMPISKIGEVFKQGTVDEIWLTFPDPHPKKRSAKHRLTGELFLRQYRNILKEKGRLKFKTDNRELFLWSLEQFVAEKWQFHELTFDLHESKLSSEYKIKTAYESKFTAQGIPTNFVNLSAD